MRRFVPDWEIDSAGTSAWHIGKPPDLRAQSEASKRSYDMRNLRARQVTAEDFEKFDKIFAMDRSNHTALENMRPQGNHTPVELFLGDQEVPDPYYDNSFARMFDLIEARAREMTHKF